MSVEDSGKEESVSVDVIQDQIDKIVLSIFEAMRSSPADSVVDDISNGIIESFHQASNAIDSLIGIDKTKREQEAIISEASREYVVRRSNVLKLESDLLRLNTLADSKLSEALDRHEASFPGESS
jgi:hypothetical protein